MVSKDTWKKLSEVTTTQWGMITRQQMKAVGIPGTTIARLTSSDSLCTRIAHGVYHIAGCPITSDQDLIAAWLQLAPGTVAWNRSVEQGVISHRSAALIFDMGDLPADLHEFTVKRYKQSRRPDVKLHTKNYSERDCIRHHGLWITRPARTIADLLESYPDLESVGQLTIDALNTGYESRLTIAEYLDPYAKRFGYTKGDGESFLESLTSNVPNNIS